MTAVGSRHQSAILADLARSVIREQRASLVGTWPRAAALLGRQALESALDQFWTQTAPGVETASRHAQLLCLPEYAGVVLARRVRSAWHLLSGACHHHAYELPPIASELNGWLDDVQALIDEVRRLGRTG